MAAQTYNVEFKGYWREPFIGSIPGKSGVYCVYVCTENNDNTVTLHRLVYIGESSNVKDRIAEHEKWSDWKKYVGTGQELCFTFGYVNSTHRDRVEAAFINKHKPLVNTEYKFYFPFNTTSINNSGANSLLEKSFTIYSS